jgi:serine/threonine protein kinase
VSARLIRCPHCDRRHDASLPICPTTGKLIAQEETSAPLSRARSLVVNKRALIGATVGGKYVVRAILGEGGMGTVYEAEHNAIGRAVAIKVLHPQQMRKKEAVKRFHHEARAAGAIGHPNICEVYDLGTLEDGRPYLVMEKLVGKTLADRIKEVGEVPIDEVADVLTQVLSGLVAAHAKGILHRDIKPENVFLTARVGCPPVAKLLDFGVSKITSPLGAGADEEMDLTRTGMVMGTPYYMSPEQARGERNLDGRVDIYACGVLAYEALTSKRPFTANNYNSLLLQILDAKLRPPRELRPDIPRAFERIIQKAMARKRDHRYPNAAEFQLDLQRLRGYGREYTHTPGGTRRPVVELPSDDLDAHSSSVDIPIAVRRSAAPPVAPGAARARGFEDQPTEIDRLRDFSMSDDEDDAATALMPRDEIRKIESLAEPPPPFEPFDSDVTTRTDHPILRNLPRAPKRGKSTR